MTKRKRSKERPRPPRIPFTFPQLPKRRTNTGPEIKPEEPPIPPKIPNLPFSVPPSSYTSKPFLDVPYSRPSLEKTPKMFRLRRFFKAPFLKVEPDKPIRMSRFPTFSFPPLYRRRER